MYFNVEITDYFFVKMRVFNRPASSSGKFVVRKKAIKTLMNQVLELITFDSLAFNNTE